MCMDDANSRCCAAVAAGRSERRADGAVPSDFPHERRYFVVGVEMRVFCLKRFYKVINTEMWFNKIVQWKGITWCSRKSYDFIILTNV